MEANRLEHLRAKAAKQKKYSPASWFSVIFSYRGRAAHHIRHPLAWVLLVSVVAAVVSASHGTRKWTAWLKRVEAAEALLRMALSFLLVFRLGRSATRYWEARQKAGEGEGSGPAIGMLLGRATEPRAKRVRVTARCRKVTTRTVGTVSGPEGAESTCFE